MSSGEDGVLPGAAGTMSKVIMCSERATGIQNCTLMMEAFV